ncbi:hypothetical protein JQV19_06230 [Sulfitobacter mediterraneus]|uniref:hypothetical protein n=1 Tax=Sulfitobacter mediterraneus TaxID=83219 RepID=UPI001939854D|nr:hypothetical protein [Sulfitobacter mediterraneus]MBM1556246.1 hypothetical protein [Sulfitobacter mediterraneus]MBM1567716.1 hypothetical protein [Sulfitobacter mediterraneus]MBM1571600.1 hypothetical protein [Sulfitobacter mediterraneus]MBM1575388.1 hypothetical protein [Sulfitobacter mediterraneus]MBM1579121.1 hypothetical protein [Sulfitobacter mediterraneus]
MPELHPFEKFKLNLTTNNPRKDSFSGFSGDKKKSPEKKLLGEILEKSASPEGRFSILETAQREAEIKFSLNPSNAESLVKGSGDARVAWMYYYYLHLKVPKSPKLADVDRMVLGGNRTYPSYFGEFVDGREYSAPSSAPRTYASVSDDDATVGSRHQSGSRKVNRTLVFTVTGLVLLGLFGFLTSPMFQADKLPSEGLLTVDLRGVTQDGDPSISTLAPAPFLTESELVRFEFGVSGTDKMLAVGVYRMISDIGDGELKEVFRIGTGVTHSPNLVVRDTLSGSMDKFGILVLGCVTRGCDKTTKAFDKILEFPPDIPEFALGTEVDTSKVDQFFVPTNIISGV